MKLFHDPGTAAMVPHILLEEIGVPFELVPVARADQAHKRPDYLRLNPNGLIPVLVDGDLVLYETAAIALHLYKWLAWLTNTLQASLILYFYPERWVDEGNAQGAQQVKAHAEQKVGALLAQLDAELARHGQPWFAGARYSALDPYVFTMCRWTRNFRDVPPARERAHLGPYLQRMLDRPAVQRVLASDRLAPPFV
jgi:glutathione S-transferase